ncbi:uncharacterized protein TRAVEDRAFT_122172, partial [Trametes versicolor FP-101664 SS1]|uniref:uncharacterized protein n=1 Tax=Trametes versicolor (strain FP-101664) TaxID=717944 RepID=UPI00046215F5
SGRSDVASGQRLVVSNLYDGFDLYDIATREHVRTLKTALAVNVPLPVILTSHDSEIIAGSSSGEVRVFDPSSGEELQVLDHDGEFFSPSVPAG